MVIPNKIKIGGQDISVVNEERIDPNKLGTICMAEGVLKIADNFNNRKQCESSKIKTFIHEVVHGILDTMGEFELSKNEKFVCTFSSLLIDPIEEIIKANNERTAMIIESIKTLRSLCINGKNSLSKEKKPSSKVRFYVTQEYGVHCLKLWMGKPELSEKLSWVSRSDHVHFLCDDFYCGNHNLFENYNLNPNDFTDMKEGEIREVFLNLED